MEPRSLPQRTGGAGLQYFASCEQRGLSFAAMRSLVHSKMVRLVVKKGDEVLWSSGTAGQGAIRFILTSEVALPPESWAPNGPLGECCDDSPERRRWRERRGHGHRFWRVERGR